MKDKVTKKTSTKASRKGNRTKSGKEGVIRSLQSTSSRKPEVKKDPSVPEPTTQSSQSTSTSEESKIQTSKSKSTAQSSQPASGIAEEKSQKEKLDERAKRRLQKSRRKERKEDDDCEEDHPFNKNIPRRHIPAKVIVERVERMKENALLTLDDVQYENECSQHKFRHMIEHIMEDMGPRYRRMAIPYPECHFIQHIVEQMFSFRCSQGLFMARLKNRDTLRPIDLYCYDRLLKRQDNFDPIQEAIDYKLDHFGIETAEEVVDDPELQIEKEMRLLEKQKLKWERLRQKRKEAKERKNYAKKKSTNKRPDKRQREALKSKGSS